MSMQNASEANMIRALALEGELRAWLQQASLDHDQIAECLIDVNTKWLEHPPKRPRPRELRRLTFAFAQESALIQVRERSEVERAAVAQRLSVLPQRGLPQVGPPALERQYRAVKALSTQCCQIFELYKVEGLTQQQIAARLSITEADVQHELAAAAKACADAEFSYAPRAVSLTGLASDLMDSSEPAPALHAALI
jgi:DNA-directed RNA polymerase specialized sigma24 family protein